ncbi:uncharacterized protein LOC119081206 [Bradysia coprophila]|uniref:uncharacterized protein LOC119081206 n=1 Tax=Bradysia coprophila TaxID=38358 RepID=UPI00187DBA52|nr:uncharacterized protein LOC119081206 [Bradysia coprophila]
MMWLPNCNLDELNCSLEILRKDLTSILVIKNKDRIPILYDVPMTTDRIIKDDKHGERKATKSRKYNDGNFLEALNSCNFYLNALSKERKSFDTAAYSICSNGHNQTKEDIFQSKADVKEYLELFKEKAWKSFAEINSFCISLMSIYKYLASHTAEADEVLYDFKHSIEVYERAISFDISCSDNAEKVLSALDNVKNSTRSLHSFVWTIKTLMTYSETKIDK